MNCISAFQYDDLVKKMELWRADRKLSKREQVKNFKINYTKEFLEYLEAEKEGNEYEMIDAICDMCIVCINAGAVFSDCSYEASFKIPCYQKMYKPTDDDFQILYTDLLRPLYDYATSGGRTRRIDIYPLFLQLNVRGYNPYLCLCQTINELNSRTGKWNKKEGKWIKEKGAYTEEEAIKIARERILKNPKELGNPTPSYNSKTKQWYWFFESEDIYIKLWRKADYSKCKIKE